MCKKNALPEVVCLMGLTGAGKTALAMQLYDALPVEIISVDSAMIYRGMDIGTAKPTAAQLQQYPHQLIDILAVDQQYSAAKFCTDVDLLIQQSIEAGKLPLLVGGTMLYFKAWQQGLNQLPQTPADLRLYFQQRLEAEGLAALYQLLKQCDPNTAARLSPNDPQRILRALEIFKLTGRALSEWHAEQTQGTHYRYLNIALIPENRAELHVNIERRFDAMLAEGFEQEVQQLLNQGYAKSLPAFRCVGYKQMIDYLDGQCSFKDMRFKAIAATRQLAKRQHTWLRKWSNLTTYSPQNVNLDEILAILRP